MPYLDIKRFEGFGGHTRGKEARREDADVVGTSTCCVFGKCDGFLGALRTSTSHDGKIMEAMLVGDLARSTSQLEIGD